MHIFKVQTHVKHTMRLEKAGVVFLLSLELGTVDVCICHNRNRNKTTSNIKKKKKVMRETQSALGVWGGALRSRVGRPLRMLLVPRQEPRACTGAFWGQMRGHGQGSVIYIK